MNCPYCDCMRSNVVETRRSEDGKSVRRRRECKKCGRRFTTYETVKLPRLKVKKLDGSLQDFDRSKIRNGILRACEKRPVSDEDVERMVSGIEAELVERGSDEVSSSKIGDMVMKRLKKADKVAYIRFASVYRSFEDINSFKNEIERFDG